MALNIWRFTDGKPGHDSQSIGLCEAIERLKPSKRFDIQIEPAFKSFKHFLFKTFPKNSLLPNPNLIIGAGHSTHLPMLAARQTYGGKIVLLMKPSLPLSFFDMCMIPEHDQAPVKKNVINTVGALNPVQFNKNKTASMGLILIGGPSKHFYWDSAAILKQIKHIVANDTKINWIVADSPRTPKDTLTKLQTYELKNSQLAHYAETDTTKLRRFIYDAGSIWVTKDSISMIYEALSSGAKVGLIELQSRRISRVEKGVDTLVDKNTLLTYSKWKDNSELTTSIDKFNEAERCANILREKSILD